MRQWAYVSAGVLFAWAAATGCGGTDSQGSPGSKGGTDAPGGLPSVGAGEGGGSGETTSPGNGGSPVSSGGFGDEGGAGGQATATEGGRAGDATGAGADSGAGGEMAAGAGGEAGSASPDCAVVTGGVLDWNVTPARLTGKLTLNGAATSINPRGTFWLVDPRTGDEALLGDTYESSYSAAVLPKTYDLVYRFTALSLPTTPVGARHTSRVVRHDVKIDASGTLDANLETVTVSGAITLDGQASSAKGGTLWLVSTTSSDEVLLHRLDGTSSYSAWVAPGTYDVYYRATPNVAPGGGPLGNSNARLLSAVSIQADRTLDVDLPSITLSGWLTVNGVRLATGTGSVILRRAGGDSVVLGAAGSGSRYSTRLVPGSYEVYFGLGNPDPSGRVNQNARLAGAVSLEQSRSDFDVDVPVVTSGASVTLDGSVVPSADYGNRVVLRAAEPPFGSRDSATIAFLQAVSFPAAVYIVPGRYDVHLVNTSTGTTSGIVGPVRNRDARVASGLDLTATGKVTLDVPLVSLTGSSMTAPTPAGGHVVLSSRTQAGDFADLTQAGAGAYSARVVPGRYDVIYENRLVYDWEPDVPRARNTHRVLRRDVDLTSAGATTLDIEARAQKLQGKVSLDGQLAVASYAGRLVLRSADGTDSAYLAAVTAASYSAWVFPGTYDVHFVNTSPTTTTPLVRNANARLGCVIVPDG